MTTVPSFFAASTRLSQPAGLAPAPEPLGAAAPPHAARNSRASSARSLMARPVYNGWTVMAVIGVNDALAQERNDADPHGELCGQRPGHRLGDGQPVLVSR